MSHRLARTAKRLARVKRLAPKRRKLLMKGIAKIPRTKRI